MHYLFPTPDCRFGVVALRVEDKNGKPKPDSDRDYDNEHKDGDHQYLLTIVSVNHDAPPTAPTALMELIEDKFSERGPEIVKFLKTCYFGADAFEHYTRPTSQRLVFTGKVENVVPLGDALAGFNPVYGQGITVACTEVELLDMAISNSPNDICGAYWSSLNPIMEQSWDFAAAADYPFFKPGTPLPPLRVRFLSWYLGCLQKTFNWEFIGRRYFGAIHMKMPATVLTNPVMMILVLLMAIGKK
jgi:2-polyprenyl-6-methoxyphenol hydroxylase-like FAD-dependent oxidoreductase